MESVQQISIFVALGAGLLSFISPCSTAMRCVWCQPGCGSTCNAGATGWTPGGH